MNERAKEILGSGDVYLDSNSDYMMRRIGIFVLLVVVFRGVTHALGWPVDIAWGVATLYLIVMFAAERRILCDLAEAWNDLLARHQALERRHGAATTDDTGPGAAP